MGARNGSSPSPARIGPWPCGTTPPTHRLPLPAPERIARGPFPCAARGPCRHACACCCRRLGGALPVVRGRCGLPDLPRRRRLRRQARPFRPHHPGRAPNQGIGAALAWTLRRGLLAGGSAGAAAGLLLGRCPLRRRTRLRQHRPPGAPRHSCRAGLRYRHPAGAWAAPSRNGCRRPFTGQCGYAEDQQPHDPRAEDRLGLRRRPSWRRAIPPTGATPSAPMRCRGQCRTRRRSGRASTAALRRPAVPVPTSSCGGEAGP